MRPVAIDVACSVICVSVCVGKTGELCTDRDTVWDRTQVNPRNHVLIGGQDRMNPFAAARHPAKLLETFVMLLVVMCW